MLTNAEVHQKQLSDMLAKNDSLKKEIHQLQVRLTPTRCLEALPQSKPKGCRIVTDTSSI